MATAPENINSSKVEAGRLHATKHLGTSRQCQGVNKQGNRCTRSVVSLKANGHEVFGTTCAFHGGKRQKERLRRELQEKLLEQVTRKIGTPIEVDPADALLQQVWECYGNVAWLRERLRLLQTPEELNPVLAFPDLFDNKKPSRREQKKQSDTGSEDFGNNPLIQSLTGPVDPGSTPPSVYGRDHLGNLAPHVLWKLYSEERDRLSRLIKLATETGISERQQKLSEDQMRLVAHVVLSVLESPTLNLSIDQRSDGRKLAAGLLRDYDEALRGRVRAIGPAT